MRKTRPQRPSADTTRGKILKAALSLFMQHGFAGTSMGMLAEKAKINQTLIFHHFGNKQKLWQHVKASMINNIETSPINPEPNSLKAFLEEVIKQRLMIYSQCPNLRKLIRWQKLDVSSKNLNLLGTLNTAITPLQWQDPITFLQSKNLINPKLKKELILFWLISSTDAILDDDLGLFKSNPKNQKIYVDMLINSLELGLSK